MTKNSPWQQSPNGLILGTPGSGKSFAAKRSIINAFLITEDDCFIIDPDAEYFPLVSRLNGQVIKLSPTGTDFINPMDINLNIFDPDTGKSIDPLPIKSDFILSLCELVVGGKDGLTPTEKTIIDRCVTMVYEPYFADPRPENMPILEDLYNLLRKQAEPEAQHVATALEIYVKGSLRIFNNKTNVDIAAKFEAMTRREAFTEYKTADVNTEDRETKRRKYLELAGVHKDWISQKETYLWPKNHKACTRLDGVKLKLFEILQSGSDDTTFSNWAKRKINEGGNPSKPEKPTTQNHQPHTAQNQPPRQ